MAQDPRLSNLLKWSIQNQSAPDGTPPETRTPLDPSLLAALFGGPSEAELMKTAMEAITSEDPEVTLESKLVAFDNFEQLIENLDNANNIANLAVQNNIKSQEKFLAMNGIPKIIDIILDDKEDTAVRRKAIYALSSATRNYQAAMDLCTGELEKRGYTHGTVDSMNMDAVDVVMNSLKEIAGTS
ncbi:unnamed protein product [Parascedosporium putredinis]|uniref:Nucleotide exchange factor Fes1 domain-containing protein n=1 Tax=Parascedosporium putredinis TaxID=1442378 RepID=A0A9P1GU59_9PEZI|nr:unnamed protein product [Parascedosporium putredinis]CAI7987452.1 unnamed protein product [Parascedosporium putredinis]